MEPAMELTQVKKHYLMGDTVIRALDGITLSIQEGEFLSVVGQSGSGKSTLMNILGCLDLPDQGEFRLWGRRVDRCSEEELARIRNRTIGFVFQGFHLLPTLTAQENVELPLFYQGIPGSQRRAMAKQALERVELGQRLNHRPNQLSGGQQQRVAIARAMATNPQVLLADEPTGNLDQACSKEILSLLQQFHQEGRTLVLITHDPEVAVCAQRRIHIQEGRLVPLDSRLPKQGDGRVG